MTDPAGLGAALATVVIVAGGAVRQWTALRRHHVDVVGRLRALEDELRELRDRFDRWTHLP